MMAFLGVLPINRRSRMKMQRAGGLGGQLLGIRRSIFLVNNARPNVLASSEWNLCVGATFSIFTKQAYLPCAHDAGRIFPTTTPRHLSLGAQRTVPSSVDAGVNRNAVLGAVRSFVATASGSQQAAEGQAPPPPTPAGGVDAGMFMVVKAQGKQYKICLNDSITTEKLVGYNAGDKFTFDQVLLVGLKDTTTWIGQPLVEEASAVGIVEQQTKSPKMYIFKKRRRKNSRRLRGFRADVTSIRIVELNAPSTKP